jgi:hypothetical protein
MLDGEEVSHSQRQGSFTHTTFEVDYTRDDRHQAHPSSFAALTIRMSC